MVQLLAVSAIYIGATSVQVRQFRRFHLAIMITSVEGLCEKPIELFDCLRRLDILQPSIGARSNPPTDDIRVPSEESAELAGFLVPSFDSDSRYKLVQSVTMGLFVSNVD